MERFTDESQAPYVTAGLSRYGADYYAVLGVPLDAPTDQIRQSYLKAAKLLHPDRHVDDEGCKQEASKIFSALVTPAYDVLNRQSRRQEYDMLMGLIAVRLTEAGIGNMSEPAIEEMRTCRTLAALQIAYRTAVEACAERQYREIQFTLAATNELSQINLAYLLCTQKFELEKAQPAQAKPKPASGAAVEVGTPATPSATSINWSERHFDRGQDLLKRKQYEEAIQSFREALRLDPDNANYHAYLGLTYIRRGWPGMAKAQFQKALALDPKQELAIQYMRGPGAAPGGQDSSKKPPDKPKGLFDQLWNKLNKPL